MRAALLILLTLAAPALARAAEPQAGPPPQPKVKPAGDTAPGATRAGKGSAAKAPGAKKLKPGAAATAAVWSSTSRSARSSTES